jgi:transcriptional regulator with XRE-family HTH domain
MNCVGRLQINLLAGTKFPLQITAIDPEELGEAMASLRGRRSQRQVSRAAGVSPASWSQYELGRRRPRAGNLAKILKGLGCTREQLEGAVWRVRVRRLRELGEGLAEEDDLPPMTGRAPFEGLTLPGAAGPRAPGAAGLGPGALPPELRAILARHSSALQEAFAFLLRRGA